MESATLRNRPGQSGIAARLREVDSDTVAKVAFGVLCAGFLVGFLVYPTYPNYDSYYSLLWGREVLDAQAPFFEGFRVPTEHPLGIAAGAVLSLLGEVGDRVWVAMTLASYLWLVWGIYRLGRVAFTPLIGAIAALLLLTRFDFAFLAARGYLDVPYMAIVVWAAVMEATRPRRGWPVFALLAAAGLLRPEAWILAGLYFLWMSVGASWGARARYAAMAAVAPLTWAAVDAAVTGDPLFSLHYTSSSAEDLGRQRTLSEIPSALPQFFANLVKLPVLLAALLGIGVALWAAPRRAVMPLVLLASGIGTFVLIGIAGLSVIERYLIVAALALLVFAAVGAGGFTMLRPGRLRTGWMTVSAVLVLAGAVFTATRVDLTKLTNELQFRGDAHASLSTVLHEPGVTRALRCGPLTVPNHKLVPDARWILDLPRDRVLARADPNGPRPSRGVALYVTSRFAIFRHAFTNPVDPTSVQVPPPGWQRIATSDYVAAYARC
ncbi:MAG TPA: hypothetical protein VEX67_17415 [Solirubrobacteraceae bacterium]|nr:hypothetical protein [Solirubrobacteraceae bacterium]